MAVCSNPFVSSAVRIARTRPSIMSLGATMSAPARACDNAAFCNSASVASLSTPPSRRMPQCPCDVYSHMQTSVITTNGLLHWALLVPRAAALFVLAIRNAEEQNATDAERGGCMRVAEHFVDGQLVHTRHRGHRGAHCVARAHEHRQDEFGRRENRFA